jgi:hypothetical protein
MMVLALQASALASQLLSTAFLSYGIFVGFSTYFTFILHFASLLKTTINFLVFFFFNKKFKKVCMSLICKGPYVNLYRKNASVFQFN